MKLNLKNLSAVNCDIDKMLSVIENYTCSQVPFMWQLLEAVLTNPGQCAMYILVNIDTYHHIF